MSVIHEYEGERWVFVKGAAGGFVPITTHGFKDGKVVPIEKVDFEDAQKVNESMGSKSMRVIALAARKLEPDEDIEDV